MQALDAVFAEAVRLHGGRVAIEVPASAGRPRASVTYDELDARARGVRAALDAVAGASAPEGPDQQVVLVVLPRDGVEVYAAQLGISRGGRAWCCLDPSHPDAHLEAVLRDAAPVAVLTDHRHAARLRGFAGAVPVLEVEADGPPGVHADAARSTADGIAYLISTSGTTGEPKCVMVRHASIVALVEADRARFGLGPGDRVAQCSSNAYDSSIEETWLALAVGATLVPVDDEVVRSGPDLPAWLREQGITVFCPPPTLLRAMGVEDPAKELPALRLVYVGGEALPQDVSDRWSAALWLENGYGPTECCVTCIRGRMHPGIPVHLGDAVPGSRAIIARDDGSEAGDGEEGELWMSGECLALGYRGKAALTASRFTQEPRVGRVYRTGDLVRRQGGAIEYLGRIDAQVKVRGHRVELGAVEACLATCPGVREAACALVGEGATAQLGALVVGDGIDTAAVLARARAQLPASMVPGVLQAATGLPRLVSGKVDRRAVAASLAAARGGSVDARSWDALAGDARQPLEVRVAACAAAATGASDLPDAGRHFFEDLGGDSLRAVDLVLRIRRLVGIEARVRMVYDAQTIGELVRALDDARGERPAAAPVEDRRRVGRAPLRRKLAAWTAQGAVLGIGLVGGGAAASWIAFRGGPGAIEALGAAGVALVAPLAWMAARLAWLPLAVAATVGLKRVLIGRYEPGWIAAWSGRHVREWMIEQVAGTIPWSLVEGTALAGWTLRALGARVGASVHVHRGANLHRGGWDLLELGDGVTIAQDAVVLTGRLEPGGIEHGRVTIGAGATIGVRATVEPGATVGEDALVAPLSTVPSTARVPAGAVWDGVPGGVVGAVSADPVQRTEHGGPMRHAAMALSLRAGAMVLAGACAAGIAALVEWAWGLDGARALDARAGALGVLPMACAAAVLWVPVWLVVTALTLRWGGAIRAGVHPVHGLVALRIWWRTGVVESAGRWISGTLLWPVWLRLAGMRIGRDTEVSSIIDTLPETVEIGEGCFFADGIYFASPVWSRGCVTVSSTRLGNGTFVGNHAVIPAGFHYPDGMFIGVSTVAPAGARGGEGWFGVPPMRLPRRDVVEVDRRLTHEPGPLRRFNRWMWECARCLVVVPAVVAAAIWVEVAAAGADSVASMPWFGALAGLAAWSWLVVFGIAAKWMLLGRVRPGQHGLWSCWCSRWDYLYVLWWFSARAALARVEGTPILAWCLRGVGTRIGRDVLLGPGATQIVDPDMLSFGDRSSVACHPQAHTFEDRVLKIDRVRIEDDAQAGENSVVFYASVIEAGARLEPGSVLMKGGVVAAGTRACGAPVG